jgi:hypothetical protein
VEATRTFVCDAVAVLVFDFWFFGFCWRFFAGIRELFVVRQGCPCAGRHLLSLPPQRK